MEGYLLIGEGDILEETTLRENQTSKETRLLVAQKPYSKDGLRVTVLRASVDEAGIQSGTEFHVKQPRRQRISGVGLVPARTEGMDEGPSDMPAVSTYRLVGRRNDPKYAEIRWSRRSVSFSRDGALYRDRTPARRRK